MIGQPLKGCRALLCCCNTVNPGLPARVSWQCWVSIACTIRLWLCRAALSAGKKKPEVGTRYPSTALRDEKQSPASLEPPRSNDDPAQPRDRAGPGAAGDQPRRCRCPRSADSTAHAIWNWTPKPRRLAAQALRYCFPAEPAHHDHGNDDQHMRLHRTTAAGSSRFPPVPVPQAQAAGGGGGSGAAGGGSGAGGVGLRSRSGAGLGAGARRRRLGAQAQEGSGAGFSSRRRRRRRLGRRREEPRPALPAHAPRPKCQR